MSYNVRFEKEGISIHKVVRISPKYRHNRLPNSRTSAALHKPKQICMQSSKIWASNGEVTLQKEFCRGTTKLTRSMS